MLAGSPGAQGSVAGLGADPSGTLGPRESGGRHRPGAYLDMKIYLEKNLEEERQILLQQQRICRNRARKYFVESNRRKKAFEEKRKEQEEKEYQMREQILQQRKQKFEEVTEKFQRAHIPLSQRRRPVFQKPVPPLEEALKQIQESNLKSEVSLPLSHRSTVNWKAVEAALPSALSKNDLKHQKHLLCKISCDKETPQDNKMTSLTANKNMFQLKLEETQKLLEDQHLSSLQKFCDEVNQINTETLSSIDSLEAGELEEIYVALDKESTAWTQQNAGVSLKSAHLQSATLNCFDEDKLSVSKTQHINDWLTNLDVQNTQSITPYSDILNKSSVLSSWECFGNKEQTPCTLSRTMQRVPSTANDSGVFVCSAPRVALGRKSEKASETSTVRTSDTTPGTLKKERPSVTERTTFKVIKAWTTPASHTQKAGPRSSPGKQPEFTQENRTSSSPASSVPVVTPLSARPFANSNMHIKEVDPVQCSDKSEELKDVKNENTKYFNCNEKESPLFSRNLQATCIPQNSDLKDRKQKTAKTSAQSSKVTSGDDLHDRHKKMKYNIHERNSVRFLKSILKKESKYEHDYLKTLIINQAFMFRNKTAEAIRDSVELTKEKGKDAEIPKTIKKLRWFDETGNTENSAGNSHSLKSSPGVSQQLHIKSETGSNTWGIPDCAINTLDRKASKPDSVSENVANLRESENDSVPLNFFIYSDHTFTKQAWPACKRGEIKTPVYNGDPKTQKVKPHGGGAKGIRRIGPEKVQPGLEYVNRKGTIMQPQSASKASMFAQTQGMLIIPHPPPKPPSHIRSGKNMQVSQCQSIMPENSQSIMSQNCFNSVYVLPSEHKSCQWNEESSPPHSDVSSDLVTVIPTLPSYYYSECQTLAKPNHLNRTQMVSQQDGTLYCTQRSPVGEESSQPVTHGNTEEESILLWKRGKNRLGQNEKVTDSAVTRRKRIVGNKWRTLLDQKRKTSESVGMKSGEQSFVQSVQLSSSEPKQTTRGSSNTEEDSILDFLMAENLVKVSVPEDEILTAMKSNELQKPNPSLNKTQKFNICTLSTEEQKILQSLSRLNERLYNVQETICKNPSIKNALQLVPLLEYHDIECT
uniref:Centrosomal protein 126 n=1 Tax=Jaculus jaculus TaxID=51337 RepID=A0A8C5KN59_JACJA